MASKFAFHPPMNMRMPLVKSKQSSAMENLTEGLDLWFLPWSTLPSLYLGFKDHQINYDHQ